MPKSVLVADDSVTIRKVIGLIFAHEDFSLTVVDNGLDAIHRAREARPDVVLADCMMPGKNGYEVCEALKNDPSTQQIPVLLLAGTFEPFDENRARAVRADGHVVKPFESQAFLDKVKALVGMPAGVPVMTGYTPVSSGSIVTNPKSATVAPTAAAAAAAPVGNQPRPMPGPAGMPGGGMPMGRPPPGAPPAGMRPGGIPPAPGMPMGRPPPAGMPGAPGMPMGRPPPGAPGMPMGRPPPGQMMGGQPGMPPMGMPRAPGPGMPGQAPGGFPRPPGGPMPGGPMPGGAPPRRDPMGFGGAPGMPPGGLPPQGYRPPPQQQPQYRPPPPQHAPAHHPPPPQANPLSLDGDGGEAMLRNALNAASKEVIEKIAWEVVPQLAETIIRQELDRLIKDREAKN